MIIYSTKIRFAGESSILLTTESGVPVAILDRAQIEALLKEWRGQ